MSDEKAIVTLNTIEFMLSDMGHSAEYAEALRMAKDAIRGKSQAVVKKCIGRPLQSGTMGMKGD